MFKPIETSSFEFPITPEKSITITSEDLSGVGLLSPDIPLAIAKAFQRKCLMGQTSIDRLIFTPEIVFTLSHSELARFEPMPNEGVRVADSMEDFSILPINSAERAQAVGRVSRTRTGLAKIIKAKTNGQYTIGFRNNHIIIVDTSVKKADLVIGGRRYIDALPLCDFEAHKQKDGDLEKVSEKVAEGYRGFQSDVLLAVAAAGTDGINIQRDANSNYRLGSINRSHRWSGLQSMVAGTNSYWRNHPATEFLSLSMLGMRLRVFDFSVEKDFELYKRIGTNKKPYAFIRAAEAISEREIKPVGREAANPFASGALAVPREP